MSCCGKYFPCQQTQEQSRKNNNLWEMAGEVQQENKGKILPERLWDSSPVAAWVKACRGARGKPSALRKAKVASCSILSVWSLVMHSNYSLHHTWIQNGVFFLLWLRNTPQSQFKNIYGLYREIMLLQYPII